jgi:DNA-binding response OmpR family regulator
MITSICIVEDDEDVRYLLTRTLEKEGYRVEAFENAYPLFDKEDDWPSLFILDIEIPGINGLEICKWIKSQDETRHIPVMFLSGSPELRVLASNTAADEYLAKPFSTPELLAIIRRTIQSRALA